MADSDPEGVVKKLEQAYAEFRAKQKKLRLVA